MFCSKCGNQLTEGAKFCTKCGSAAPQSQPETIKPVEETTKFEEVKVNQPEIKETGSQQPEQTNLDPNINNVTGAVTGSRSEDFVGQQNIQYENSGDEVNTVSAEKKSFKTGIVVAAVAAVLILLIGAGFFYFINPFASSPVSNSSTEVSTNADGILDEIEKKLEAFDEYIIDDFKSEYDTLMNKVSDQKTEKDYDKAKALLQEVKDFEGKVQKNNSELISKMLTETKAKDSSKAYDDELEKIKGYETNVNNFVKENKYVSAKKELEEWNKLLEAMNVVNDNYSISVQQIDFNSFPKIKVYLSIEDKATKEVPKQLEGRFFYIAEKDAKNNAFVKQTIQKVIQLDQQESLNINMVADVSTSMDGGPLDSAKQIMSGFLEQVQFGSKDKVELTAFSNGVRTCASFTDDKVLLQSEIANLVTDDQTALYDALFAAVNTTAVQSGAKCVMAFTDGEDNYSKCTPNDVIQVAKRYNVPVFIIGIGSGVNTTDLQNICNSTNGMYFHANNAAEMATLYQNIYKKNKEMYLVEYETQNSQDMMTQKTIEVSVQTRKAGGQSTYTFTPRPLPSTSGKVNNTDAISALIGNYLISYIDAINNHDYSYIEKYLVPGGGIAKEVKPYIMKDIQEKLLSYEIVNKEMKGTDKCIVTTRETYEVQNHSDPLHMRVLQGKYECQKQADGTWKLLNYADLFKVLSKINY